MPDQFDHYRANLAGEIKTFTSEPEAGYYELRDKKNERRDAVALWKGGDGSWRVQVNGKPSKRSPDDLWTWICNRPIPFDLYKAVSASGAWPDAAPELPERGGIGDNQPPDDEGAELAKRLQQLEDETAAITKFLAVPIDTQERADQASNWADRLAKLKKWLADEYERRNRPLLDMQNDLRKSYLAPSQEAQRLAQLLTKAQTGFLADQQRKADEAARAEREAAERERQKQIDAARAEGGEDAAMKTAMELPSTPVETPKAASGGATGRKTTLRDVKAVEVIDYAAFATFLIRGGEGKAAPGECLNGDLKDTLDKLARKMTGVLEIGQEFPGGKVVSKKEARR